MAINKQAASCDGMLAGTLDGMLNPMLDGMPDHMLDYFFGCMPDAIMRAKTLSFKLRMLGSEDWQSALGNCGRLLRWAAWLRVPVIGPGSWADQLRTWAISS